MRAFWVIRHTEKGSSTRFHYAEAFPKAAHMVFYMFHNMIADQYIKMIIRISYLRHINMVFCIPACLNIAGNIAGFFSQPSEQVGFRREMKDMLPFQRDAMLYECVS